MAAAVLVLLAAGAALAGWAIRREDRSMRADLLQQARRVAQTLPLDQLRVLHGNRSDEQRPEYRRLKEQLMAAQQIDPDWEWIYLMGRRSGGAVYFQMDSEAYDAPDPSPPGQIYSEASPVLHAVFDKRIGATEGPIPDRWGVWVSAFVPLVDPKTDRLVTVVGIDVEASTWRWKTLRAGIVPALATAALLAILLTGYRLERQRKKLAGKARRPWRHLEAAASLSAGLVLTATAAWLAHSIEANHLEEAFVSLAEIKSERILDAFTSLRQSELEGLARFLEGSENVTSREFRRYARHLVRVPEVVAWTWVPAVEGAKKTEFEQFVRDAGWQGPEYRIWETDAAGQILPAADRPFHYPIYYAESAEALSKYGIAPGRDWAAIDAVRAALEASERTGLIGATDVLPPLPGATSQRTLVLMFRPVRKIPHPAMPNGWAMAAVDPQAFLRSFLGENPEENRQVAMDLLVLKAGAAPERIASIAAPDSSGAPPERLSDPWTLTRPVIAFGKTYAVAVRPSKDFIAGHSVYLGWMALLAGLSITAAGSLVIGVIAHRREDMERLVDEQSHDLAVALRRYDLLSEENRVATWEIDAAGRYTELSRMAETILGYRPDELVGKKRFYDLHPEKGRKEIRDWFARKVRAGESFSNVVHPVVSASGAIVWASTSGIPMRDAEGRVRGYWGTSADVTERIRAEEALRESHALFSLFMHHSPVYTYIKEVTATESRVLVASENFQEMIGIPGSKMAGKTMAELFPPEFAAKIAADDWNVVSRGQTLKLDERLNGRDYVSIKFPIVQREKTLLAGYTLDITDRVRAEEEVRKSRARLLEAQALAHLGHWELDHSTRRLEWSEEIYRIFGLEPRSFVPTYESFLEAIHPDDRAAVDRAFSESLRNRTPYAIVHRLQMRNGAVKVVQEQGETSYDAEGHPLRSVGTVQDVTAAHQIQEALRDSERKYRTLTESMKDVVWILDAETLKFLYVSPSVEKLRGFSPEEVLAGTVADSLEPGQMEKFGPVLRENADKFRRGEITSDAFFTLELRQPRKNAPPIVTEAICRFWRNEQTGRLELHGTTRDVTDRKRAEDELRESRRRYAGLLAHLPGMAYRCPNDRFQAMDFVSEGCRELTGYAPEDLVGNATASFNDLVGPEYRDKMAKQWRNALSRRLKAEAEYEIRTRSGETKWVWEQGEGVYDEENRLVAVEGFIADVTDRKRAGAERERLTAAIEQSGDAVLIADAAGTILYVNEAFAKITGYSREEAVGQNPKILKSGRQDPEFYRQMWARLGSGKPWEGKFVNRRKDGRLYTEMATISPVRDAGGRIVNYVSVGRDISQQLLDQAEKEHLQSQLLQAQKMESIGRLAGGVAHDFNNMLQAILGYAEMALEQAPPGQPLHTDILEIQKAAQRSAALTRQLQAFARKQTVEPRPMDINAAVEGMFDMLRRLIGEDVRLAWKPDRKLAQIYMDPGQIDQLVTNLCINARDAIAGAPAGEIVLETRNATVPRALPSPYGNVEPGSYILLSVSDNGSGMPADVLAHIFEPFFTTKQMGKGTGLGLATVYGIIRQNHGGIRVESKPGKGTVFQVYLPCHAKGSAPEMPAPEPDAPRIPAGGETILLVEDEATLLQTATRMLESLGYEVLATSSPEEALRLAEQHQDRIALLLTDVIMPEMNGPELVQRLKERFPALRHLYMSGYTANLIAEQGVRDDSVNFIQKPFSRKSLAKKVRESIGKG
ncbi:MAG: PAS domain S-box protein [Kiritimatiellia bacterium]